MKIAAISAAPLVSGQVIGGSQRILQQVVAGLSERGHDVRVYCTRTEANLSGFKIGRADVLPILQLRGAFPATHQVSPAALSLTASAISSAGEWADHVYLHADAMYLRQALGSADPVRSIHDLVYEEALLSVTTLNASATIVPSDYLKRCVEATAAITGSGFVEPVVTVPNGIEIPTSISPKLPSSIRPREDGDIILLYPHRPQESKGLLESIEVAITLERELPERKIRMLVPAYSADSNFDEAAQSLESLNTAIQEHGGNDIVELHEWLSPEDMPAYLAAGDVTLNLGRFVESFGLVPIESVVAGTPSISARVGALREFESVPGINLVPYGDRDQAVTAILDSVSDPPSLDDVRAEVSDSYSIEVMVDGYESVITSSDHSRRRVEFDQHRLALAPWCEIQDGRIWNDYSSTATAYKELVVELNKQGSISTSDIPSTMIENAVQRGDLIPTLRFES
jgi:glycosyltransferase involved in cell wall biosynthesis